MGMGDNDGTAVPIGADDPEGDARGASLVWLDGRGRAWNVELAVDRIVLRRNDKVVDLPAEAWPRDLYVASHEDAFIVRVSTFDTELGFMVPAEQAASFLAHVGAGCVRADVELTAGDGPTARAPLLWPKVSPYAVWALMCSSLVFVPVLGLVPALVTVVLLILHRGHTRRARAWGHSRALCLAATALLLIGLVVSALATWGLLNSHDDPRATYGLAVEGTTNEERASAGHPGQMTASSSFLEREHNWGVIVAALVVVLLSLSFHEAAHATSAWWLGDDFARRLGRVTLNPVAHVDLFGTIILPLFLALTGWGVFGWARPVPVRTEYLDRPRRAQILISIAGPGSNLLLAAVSFTLLLGLGCTVGALAPEAQVTNYTSVRFTDAVSASGFTLASLFGPACTVLKLSFMINTLLAFFNLIPIPPLDGSWVLEHLFPNTVGRIIERIRPFGFLIFLLLLGTDVFEYLLLPAAVVLAPGFGLLIWCTPF